MIAKRTSLTMALSLASLLTMSAHAMQQPLALSGNLGYFYTISQTEQKKLGENSYVLGSLNADSYLWRPWLATFNVGGTASGSYSLVEEGIQKDSYLMSSRGDFRLLPRSRTPLVLSYYMQNNLNPTTSDSTISAMNRALFGYDIKTRFFGARQSFIGRGGDQVDLWYHNRIRGAKDIGDASDQTFGGKIRSRFADHNFYASGSYQTREGGFRDNKAQTRYITAMHHYMPNSQFYVKTLATHTNYENKSDKTNGSFLANNTSMVNQASSFFYWRPVYKPYILNGAIRAHQRQLNDNITSAINDTLGVNGQLAATYTLNRRTQLTASVNGTALDTDRRTNVSSTQTVQMMYQSDQVLYQSFNYRWFANTGIGNDVGLEDNKLSDEESLYFELSQNLNAGIGHSLNKRWIAGNRATIRASFTQQAREYFVTEDFGSIFTVSHTGNLAWNMDVRKGGAFAQMSLMDTRSFFDNSLEMQIVNFQFSRTMPLTRLSAWSGNLALQSSRRDDGTSDARFFDEFLTVTTGRLSYQHSRLFGIYKLKFRTRLDLSATLNKAGEDRLKGDWENQLGYNIGKLATSVVTRWVGSNSGLGSKTLIFQINRTF